MFIIVKLFIGALILLDQYTKKRARLELADNKKIEHKYMTFKLVKNKGAFRGLLKDKPMLLLGFQIISMLLVFVLLVMQVFGKKDKMLTIGLSFIFAGAFGNLIDRLVDKYVTDFFAIKWTKNLYYNLADMFIFLGAIITVLRGNKL